MPFLSYKSDAKYTEIDSGKPGVRKFFFRSSGQPYESPLNKNEEVRNVLLYEDSLMLLCYTYKTKKSKNGKKQEYRESNGRFTFSFKRRTKEGTPLFRILDDRYRDHSLGLGSFYDGVFIREHIARIARQQGIHVDDYWIDKPYFYAFIAYPLLAQWFDINCRGRLYREAMFESSHLSSISMIEEYRRNFLRSSFEYVVKDSFKEMGSDQEFLESVRHANIVRMSSLIACKRFFTKEEIKILMSSPAHLALDDFPVATIKKILKKISPNKRFASMFVPYSGAANFWGQEETMSEMVNSTDGFYDWHPLRPTF